MRALSPAAIFPWAVAAAAATVLAALFAPVPQLIGGDGFAVYLPVAWGLQDGLGIRAFSALEYGYFRFPGYPVLIYLTSLLTGDAVPAVTWIQIACCAAFALSFAFIFQPLIGRPATLLALALFFFSECFAMAAFASTPDLSCLALAAGSIALIFHRSSGTRWFFAGLLAASAFLFRFNAIYLLLLLPATALGRATPQRHLPALLLGLLLPLGAWSLVSLALRDRLFWIPSGPTLIPNHPYHPALAARTLGAILHRVLLGGPLEIATLAFWPVPSFLALTALLGLRREHARAALWFGATVVLSWICIAPAHFEARYYPVQVLALATAAAWGTIRLVRSPRAAALLAIALIAITAIDRRHIPGRKIASYQHAFEMIEWSRALAARAVELGPGPIGISEIAYHLSPIRQAFRERGAGEDARLICCRSSPGDAAYLYLASYGPLPEHLTRVDLPYETGPLQLYRVDRAP